MCVAGIFENCTFEGLIGGVDSHGPVTSVAQAVTRLQILACHGTPPSYSSPPWLPSQTAPRSLKILREREEEEDIITDKQQLPTIFTISTDFKLNISCTIKYHIPKIFNFLGPLSIKNMSKGVRECVLFVSLM